MILLCPLLVCFCLYMQGVDSLKLLITVVLIMYPFIINVLIAFGRTIIMSKEGCLVKFLFIQKNYRWEDFKTKRYECTESIVPPFERGSPYTRGVLLSTRNISKRSSLKLATRCYFTICPFSFIYVYFYPGTMAERPSNAYPIYYAANAQDFWEKMLSWGVFTEKPIEDVGRFLKTGDGVVSSE